MPRDNSQETRIRPPDGAKSALPWCRSLTRTTTARISSHAGCEQVIRNRPMWLSPCPRRATIRLASPVLSGRPARSCWAQSRPSRVPRSAHGTYPRRDNFPMDGLRDMAARSGSPTAAPTDPRLIADWTRRLQSVDPAVAQLLRGLVAELAPALADHFYDGMLQDPRANRFLDPGQVQARLKPSMQRWLHQLVQADAAAVEALHQLQEHVGQVHARIGIPVDLVGRGMRLLKERMHEGIASGAGSHAEALAASLQLDGLFDLALESMTRAYTRSREAAGELDGSFRLFSLIQNVGTERERQRALLLAWENTLLYALTAEQPGPLEGLLLSRSEFG